MNIKQLQNFGNGKKDGIKHCRQIESVKKSKQGLPWSDE